MPLIYIAEDDQGIRELILYTLQVSDFEAKGFETGTALLEAVKDRRPDLVLLDIMMPEQDGLMILQKLRQNPETADLPVIMETARTAESDTVTGLDLGADDYLCKPFGMAEMLSRIRALLRRVYRKTKDRQETGEILEFEGLRLDLTAHEVTAGDQRVNLTRKEYDLLKVLARSPRKVFSRDELLMKVWDTDFAGGTRTVDVHVNTLRGKLKDAGRGIETVRGAGYRFNPEVLERSDRSQEETADGSAENSPEAAAEREDKP
ncbi:response regulator transcription factor [uncultured Faecalibaculum sp.]|uniref:response regulator transcription factor n=1 Tax=uncultured Faecalibaculum sp. TaxID=1729681 RepID=UPI00263108EF|nr:response regulator transcription factor [uncultured Faecalibaculum sp.]